MYIFLERIIDLVFSCLLWITDQIFVDLISIQSSVLNRPTSVTSLSSRARVYHLPSMGANLSQSRSPYDGDQEMSRTILVVYKLCNLMANRKKLGI